MFQLLVIAATVYKKQWISWLLQKNRIKISLDNQNFRSNVEDFGLQSDLNLGLPLLPLQPLTACHSVPCAQEMVIRPSFHHQLSFFFILLVKNMIFLGFTEPGSSLENHHFLYWILVKWKCPNSYSVRLDGQVCLKFCVVDPFLTLKKRVSNAKFKKNWAVQVHTVAIWTFPFHQKSMKKVAIF